MFLLFLRIIYLRFVSKSTECISCCLPGFTKFFCKKCCLCYILIRGLDCAFYILYNVVLPFAFASSTMLFAVDLTCAFTSNTCDFICSHLVPSLSCASDNAFLALLTSVSSCISLIWFCIMVQEVLL